jgi:hypothetical protein
MKDRRVTRIDSLSPVTDDFQYYGPVQHDSSLSIPDPAYTVLNNPVVGRGQSAA